MEQTATAPDRALPRLAERVYNTPLMVEPGKASAILSVLAPRLGLAGAEALPKPEAYRGVELQPGQETAGYRIAQGGVAVVRVHGTLVQRGGWLDAMSGMASYERIGRQVEAAAGDASVRSILLDVDSGGGEVAGCFDLADHLRRMAGRKTLWAIADETAFSAAYALASAAEKVFLTRTAGVGSIGVVAMHADWSKAEAMAGLKVTAIYAGQRKNDFSPHEPLSREARATLQAEIDRVYGLFVDTVAKHRGLDVRTVRDTEAGLYWGPDAVRAGLADEVASLDEVIARMAGSPAGMVAGLSMEAPMATDTDPKAAPAAPPASQAETPAAPQTAAAPPASQAETPAAPQTAAAPPAPPAETRAASESATASADAVAKMRAEAAEIAGMVDKWAKVNPRVTAGLAQEYIAKGMTPDQAARALNDFLAENQSPEFRNVHQPGPGAGGAAAADGGWGAIYDRMAKAMPNARQGF